MFFHDFLKITALQPRLLGCLSHVPIIAGKRIQNKIFFDFANRFLPNLFFDPFEFLVG